MHSMHSMQHGQVCHTSKKHKRRHHHPSKTDKGDSTGGETYYDPRDVAKTFGSIRHPRDTEGWYVRGVMLRNIWYRGKATARYWSAPVGNCNSDGSPLGRMIRPLGKHEAFGPIYEIMHRPRQWVEMSRWDKKNRKEIKTWVQKDFVVAVGPDPADRSKTIYVNCRTDGDPWLEPIPPGMKVLHAPPDFWPAPGEGHKEIDNPLPVNLWGVPVPRRALPHTSGQHWALRQEQGNWENWQQAPHHGRKTWHSQGARRRQRESLGRYGK